MEHVDGDAIDEAMDRCVGKIQQRGVCPDIVRERRDAYARELLPAFDENIRPQSITTDGARTILKRLSNAADIESTHPKHEYPAPHGGRRGMGEVLVRAFGSTVAVRYLDNSEEMVRERYSHIEASELGNIAADAVKAIDG